MLQKEKTRQTQRRILAAASRVFSAKGFYGTTTRELSEGCGFEQSTLYHHFGSKENLFRMTLLHTHDNIIRLLEKNVDRSAGLEEELISLFQTFERFSRKYPGQMHLLFSLVYSGPPSMVEEYSRRHLVDFENFIRKAFQRQRTGQVALRESLCTDLLFSFIFSLGSGAHPARLLNWRETLHFILTAPQKSASPP